MPSWESIDASSWPIIDEEPMGTKEKRWLSDPENRRWLFKASRVRNGTTRGEDWAEWIAWCLADMLGIPAAIVRPAGRDGERGILSLSMVASDERLVAGNELLAAVDDDYDLSVSRHNPRYSVDAVMRALDGMPPPVEGSIPSGFSAFDVWASYLMLDAWIAARDRHHENWGAVENRAGTRRLAPTFDHGNALGFQEPEERLLSMSSDPTRLERWAQKGVSPHFAGKPQLVDLAHQALQMASPPATDHWRHQLNAVNLDHVLALLSDVPRNILSEAGVTFCHRLLSLNRRRLLDVV